MRLSHLSVNRGLLTAGVLVAFSLPGLATPAAAVGLVLNGGFVPSNNLVSGPDAAPSAGLNVGTGVGGTVASIYSIKDWTVTDNPRGVSGWQNNLLYVVSDGNTFSKEGAGVNAARQNGRNNWTLYGTTGQTVNSVDRSGWYLASDGDPAYSGSIKQTLSGLTAGSRYDVTFYQAAGQFDCYLNANNTTCTDGNYNQNTTNWWEVSFDGTTQNSSVISKGANDPVSAWQKQVLTFVAGGSTAVLEFMANGTPAAQPPVALLSAITVELNGGGSPPTPGPGGSTEAAPGPLGIMGAGAAFSFGRTLRRRLQQPAAQSRK